MLRYLSLLCTAMLALLALPSYVHSQSETPESTIFLPLVMDTSLSSQWLKRVNGYRWRAGVPPVTEASLLNDNCYQHARYIAENNQVVHNQDEANPYFTPAGRDCAQKGNLWIGRGENWTPAHAIDAWMESVNHRLWLLYPTTPRFGFGFYTIADGTRSAAALDVISNFNDGADYSGWPVRYPGPNQSDVPPKQYPITIHWRYFGPAPEIGSTELRIVGGSAINHSATIPETGHKAIVITPTDPLPVNSLIEVSVTGRYDGQDFTYTWQFHTTP